MCVSEITGGKLIVIISLYYKISANLGIEPQTKEFK